MEQQYVSRRSFRILLGLVIICMLIMVWLIFRPGNSLQMGVHPNQISIREQDGTIQYSFLNGQWQDITTTNQLTGKDGKNGQDGKDGQPGTDGENGKDGADGENGKNGANGQDGTNGTDGKNGTNGTDGIDGKDGKDGKDGTNGTNGANGTDGQNGTNGVDGANGTDGQDGADGIDGQDGTDGREIELRKDTLYIQWRYEGEDNTSWRNLIAYTDLKGDKGDKGDQGEQGAQGVQGAQGIQGIQGATGAAGANGLGVPTGGSIGQILAKKSGADYDTEWMDGATRLYVQSRGQGLVTNGSGLLGNNYNFSTATFDPTETYAGGGSMRYDSRGTYFTDEFIPVDPSKSYRLGVWAKPEDGKTNVRVYIGVVLYDIDRNMIKAPEVMKFDGSTDTTLATELKNGDTTVTLTDGTGWATSASPTYSRRFAWYPYTNTKGYTHPDYTYTRNATVTDVYSERTGNVLTLRNPWSGGTLPAGTKIRNNNDGSTYKYIAAESVILPQGWSYYSGTIGGWADNGTWVGDKFQYGTSYLKIMLLPDYDRTGSKTYLSMIQLRELE